MYYNNNALVRATSKIITYASQSITILNCTSYSLTKYILNLNHATLFKLLKQRTYSKNRCHSNCYLGAFFKVWII